MLVGLGLNEFRKPDASRYAYMFSVLLMLVSADLLQGIRIPRVWAIAAVAALAVSLVSNVAQMHTAGTFFESESELNRAEAGALDLVGPYVAPDFVAESGRGWRLPLPRHLTQPAVRALRRRGPARLPRLRPRGDRRGASPDAQAAADRLLVSALDPSVQEAPDRQAGAMRSRPATALNGEASEADGCVLVSPVQPGATFALFHVAPGTGLAFYAKRPMSDVAVRALHRGPDISLGPAGKSGLISFPEDAYDGPWKVGLTYTGKVTACPVSG